MIKKISTRNFIRISSFIIAAFIVMGGFAIAGYNTANYYRDNLEYTYQRALDELSEHVSNIESTLTKGMYANTATEQHTLAAKLLSQSEGAKSSLSQLPLADTELSSINKFISQVGDFSLYISKKLSRGEESSNEDIQNLKTLDEYAKSINTDLQDILARFTDNKVRIGDYSKLAHALSNNIEAKETFINTGFHDMSEGFTDFPTMIYDGPFSDHITQMKPKLLDDKSAISLEEANLKAAEFLHMDSTKIRHEGDTEGNLSTYNFNSDDINISVTKKGGYINYFVNSRIIGENTKDFEEASGLAKEFLKSHSMADMEESYYVIQNGVCTINFAYTKNDITYYPDLVKVGVALDTGEIVSLNATGYIMNHHHRDFDTSNILSEEAAKNKLSPLLAKVDFSGLVCIPSPGLNEVLCYEFKCIGKNQEDVLVYINSQNGLEENILILLKYDNGILTV